MNTPATRIARGVAALGLLAAAAGCGGASQGETVTIMVPWSGAEFTAFYDVVEPFAASHGFRVDFEVTRAQTEQLDAAVEAKDPPDLAVLPSIGLVYEYVKDLRPLTVDPRDFVEPFRRLMTVDGAVYVVPVKADVKSLVWYDPQRTVPRPADDPAALEASGDQWCLGLESGTTSGWPGADWIADLVLAEDGAGPYEQWLTDAAPQWNAPMIQQAWNTWADLVGGSAANAATTAYNTAVGGMYPDPKKHPSVPPCQLAHGALSAMGFSTGLKAGQDYDFAAPAAPSTPLEVSADFLGMFTKDNPDAVALIDYLSTVPAQTAWVNDKSGGYAISADSGVKPGMYKNAVQGQIAALLQPGSGRRLCFGAADMMAPDVSAAFYQAVMNYTEALAAPTPDARAQAGQTLAAVLSGLDKIQNRHGPSQIPKAEICSVPPT